MSPDDLREFAEADGWRFTSAPVGDWVDAYGPEGILRWSGQHERLGPYLAERFNLQACVDVLERVCNVGTSDEINFDFHRVDGLYNLVIQDGAWFPEADGSTWTDAIIAAVLAYTRSKR